MSAKRLVQVDVNQDVWIDWLEVVAVTPGESDRISYVFMSTGEAIRIELPVDITVKRLRE